MAGNVKFVLDAESGKAVSGFLRVLDASKRVEGGVRQVSKASKETEESMGQLGEKIGDAARELGNMVTGFASFEGAKRLIENLVEELNKARDAKIKLDETGKGGYSLGVNLDNIKGWKERSLALSTQFGVNVEDVNKLREFVGMRASDMTADRQAEITESALRTFEAVNQPAVEVANAEQSILHAYPKMSVANAEAATEFLRSKAGLGAGEATQMLQSVLPAMTERNIPFDQVEAALATATKVGGSDTQIAKGVQQFMIKIPELVEGGLLQESPDLAGYFEQAGELEKKDPAGFAHAIGKRSAPAISAIAAHLDLYRDYLKEASGPETADRIEKIEEERRKHASDESKGPKIEQLEHRGEEKITPQEMGRLTRFYERRAIIKGELPFGLKGVAGNAIALAASIPEFFGDYDKNDPLVAQAEHDIGGAKANAPKASTVNFKKLRGQVQDELLGGNIDIDRRMDLSGALSKADRLQGSGDSAGAIAALQEAIDKLSEKIDRMGGGAGGGPVGQGVSEFLGTIQQFKRAADQQLAAASHLNKAAHNHLVNRNTRNNAG